MDVTESYRILELEIGASRAVVDAAYCRLVERWHPDRAASGGEDAVREAQRMVQAINDAYHTLAKIAPTGANPSGPRALPNPESRIQNSGAGREEPDPKSAESATSLPTSSPSGSRNPVSSIQNSEFGGENPGSESRNQESRIQNSGAGNQEPEIKSAKPPPPAPASTTPAMAKTKPRLPPLVGGQPSLGHAPPPPPPPPPGTWAARPAPVPSAVPLAIEASLAAPPPPKSAPPTPVRSAPPVASTPIPTPLPSPVAPTTGKEPAQPDSSSIRPKVPGLYEMLFPLGSPLRRFGPVILAAALILAILLGKHAFSSSRSKAIQAPDPKTTGRLVVKSNLADATIQATRLPSPGDATTASVDGAVDQILSGLPPGKYAVTARTEGWKEVREEVNIEAERTAEVAMNFKGGSLRLDTDPAGVTVRLGATVLGRTPLLIPQLPPGVCQLTLQYPFWPDMPFKTTITENVESTGTVRLPHGKLTVETIPSGTTVLLAGRVVGQTPLTLDSVPAGINKLTLRAKDFPLLKLSVTVGDGGEVKIHPALGSVFPVLDPAALLRAVWVRDDPDNLAPPLEGVTGLFQSRNGVVKNLNRKWLFETWLRKRYCLTSTVKSYDPVSGQVEFAEQQSELSKYRVQALLSPEARNDPDLTTQLIKGASFALYGQLTAVEEPRWPSKVITFEFSAAAPLR